MKNWKMAVVLASLTVLGGCAELPKQLDQVADNLRELGRNSTAGKPAAPTKFSQSPLANVFSGSEPASQWPRVALTIDEMPGDADFVWLDWPMQNRVGSPMASAIVVPANYCITVSAVIWKNEKTSQKVERVPYCGKDAKVGEITDDYTFSMTGWTMAPKNGFKNTGASRTSGPNPPLKSFPSRSLIIDRNNSRASLIFAHLVMGMGLDLTQDYLNEGRLWVVSTVR